MYTAFGIPREDKPARIRQVLKNYIFFGAPVGLIITMSKEMDLGQAVDVGIFLQNLMLLATERGLASCPQASWAQWPQRVRDAMKIDSDQKIIVGLALGYADDGHAVNDLEQPRIAADDFVSFDGFD
jgi:nitroreductase